MKNSLKVGAVAAAAALALAGCGSAPSESGEASASGETQSGGAAGGSIKACMVSDMGGFEDKSFNQSGKEGMEKAKSELGIDVAYAESQSDSDYAANIANMVQGGCDVIIGVGYLMADALNQAATENPDIDFALVDSTFTDPGENTKALVFNTAEAAYLAGYASAGLTSTGKVGTYLGGQIPSTAVFADGFADGIAKYNEDNGTSVELLGWDKEKQSGMATGDFEDTSKGKQFTEQLIQQGADIIMPVAGPVGAGTLAAAKEAGNVNVVWVDADGYLTQPDYGSIIITSVVKEIGQAVYDTVKTVQDGQWSSEDYVGTLANGGVGIAPFHDWDSKVPADLKSQLEDLQSQITDGTITVESENSPK
ncbi:MAG: BMP family ABC transporter substrate-binding protein [Actinomyces sp.]|nr:BMP family ABC transporter substrate-binding protein [Actinomyces sp.]MCI1642163.1 BMP family ABC transporter substrate-binding protein [Actinomyces sp.]MCI1662383.1 BMP family ABC transporter substrate-binding protein [Actinomyces sp.]MCI1788051.1 BMP family ABC transporter substrate-binding protein [Actinomyces sp.]MCI1830444.1 BMP family ABC transporter substrate-binding protein [Actinomyces sp.]MCI1866049.1 BMP family ABC transporter substrate-binding protein [Actinomyces sp.]